MLGDAAGSASLAPETEHGLGSIIIGSTNVPLPRWVVGAGGGKELAGARVGLGLLCDAVRCTGGSVVVDLGGGSASAPDEEPPSGLGSDVAVVLVGSAPAEFSRERGC